MDYTTTIDNVHSVAWGLKLQEAYLFAWFTRLHLWADKIIIKNQVYYFASKTKACSELKLLTDKPDTMYRYYKALEKKNLIEIKKIEGKDYVLLTEKAKHWGRKEVAVNRESDHSDLNPSLGNKSEDTRKQIRVNSDLNPTYHVNHDNIKKNNKKESFSDFSNDLKEPAQPKENTLIENEPLGRLEFRELPSSKLACGKHVPSPSELMNEITRWYNIQEHYYQIQHKNILDFLHRIYLLDHKAGIDSFSNEKSMYLHFFNSLMAYCKYIEGENNVTGVGRNWRVAIDNLLDLTGDSVNGKWNAENWVSKWEQYKEGKLKKLKADGSSDTVSINKLAKASYLQAK